MNWEKASRDDNARARRNQARDPATIRRSNLPATDKQRRYIAFLARKANTTANPVGTRAEAAHEVGRLKKQLQ
jgi:hypothetical protein